MEKGITMVALIFTLLIMIILAGVLIRATMGDGFLQQVNEKEKEYQELIDDTDRKKDVIKEQWGNLA